MFFVEAADTEAGDAKGGIEVMFSVPKKFHKRANKRNVLKRRTREAYRLNREQVRVKVEQSGKQLDLALVYYTKDILSYKTIENAVRRILGQVCERM
jgi:ribonuclease P protein component